MYAGAQVVVGRGTANQEVVTVTAVPSGTQFTAVFANTHASGVQVMAPTFPDQNATDPLWTQAEMLMYLSRAQNQFLTDVPCYYTTTTHSLVTGTRYQSLPTTAIQAERIAVSQYSLYCTSLTRTSGTVTVTTEDAHGLSAGQGITIVNATADTTFNGVFQVALVPTSTTLTYQQYA
jgi:hypothetical protein